MKENLYIASMMLCGRPRLTGGHLMLSCSDSVWEPVRPVPVALQAYLTDELGNRDPEYGGFLFSHDKRLLEQAREMGIFACFRGIGGNYVSYANCPMAMPAKDFGLPVSTVGWDIANGNGWVSASTDGIYPIDPFDGTALDENVSLINQYGLFENLRDCENYCNLNNVNVPARAPWYPVAILLDAQSQSILRGLLAK